jgi:type VI secretion system protein ImpK
MSDRDRPFDPFGRSDRTIPYAEPGGRRAISAAPAASPDPFAPPLADLFLPWPGPPYPAQPPPSGTPPSAASLQPSATGGVPRSQEDPLARAFPRPRDALPVPSKSPIIDAAGPLLLLLGRFRANINRLPSAALMEQVAQTIQDFEQEVRALGFSAEQARVAKYALCATTDDIVQNVPVEDRRIWTQYSMLSRFFGEGRGGIRFFEHLERAKADPVANYAILELMHACLALGFEGVHRTSAGGAALLQRIQRSLYDTLRHVRPRATHEFSPRWRGESLPALPARKRVPFWAVASVTGVLLLAIYVTLRTLLRNHSDIVAAMLLGLIPSGEVSIEHPAVVPPPPFAERRTDQPIVSDQTPEGRARNGRVEIMTPRAE